MRTRSAIWVVWRNSWAGEDVLGGVEGKEEEESLTGGETDDDDAASGPTERTAAQHEFRNTT